MKHNQKEPLEVDDEFQKQNDPTTVVLDMPDSSEGEFKKLYSGGEIEDKTVYYNLTGCILSMLSTIIGSGIVSIPYSASSVRSITLTAFSNLMCGALMLLSAQILLTVRQLVSKVYKESVSHLSISDLSYLLFGRFSVLLVNGFIGFALFGINVLFVLFFEQITISFFIDKNKQNE